MGWENTYASLSQYLIENSVLGSAGSLLGWDELTYMPPKGAETRAKQMSLIARMTHERFTAKQVGEQLEELKSAPLTPEQSANIREWKRKYIRAVRLPASLVEEVSSTSVLARQAWGEAKQANDYPKFKPWLKKTIDLQKKVATCYCGHQPANVDELYDALLDDYEPYQTSAQLRQMFGTLKPKLVDLVQKVQASKRKPKLEILKRTYPIEKQKAFAESAAKAIGFDFSAGRLDTTLHPFCSTIGAGDVRITTRYDEHDFGNCFFSVIHETGHALYEQGLKPEHWGTPMGDAVSLGVHESQSRLWENLVARSEAFWKLFYPKLQSTFPESLSDVPLDDFMFAINSISPSLIRTESDEATYNLHVLLRFEMEQALLSDSLSVDDLPAAWNKAMRDMLAVEVPDDRRGCLQDVHWSNGAFGYFPTYTLGNLNAASLFEAARNSLSDLETQFEGGDFTQLLHWLRTNVHAKGSLLPATELMQAAIGHPITPNALVSHLQRKVVRYYS